MWPCWHDDLVATFVLGAIGGFAIGRFLWLLCRRSFFGLLVYGGLTFLLVAALARGYSDFLEGLTWNLAWYVAENPAGFLGVICGFLLGRPWTSPALPHCEH